MKALTVRQPWAQAIIFGGKNIENRTVFWKYRGSLAVHAGMSWDLHGQHDPAIRAVRDDMPLWHEYGAIIGLVDLVAAHYARPSCATSARCGTWGHQSRPGGKPVVHLVLANPRPLPEPIPCRGRQGLWTPPDDVLPYLEMSANTTAGRKP